MFKKGILISKAANLLLFINYTGKQNLDKVREKLKCVVKIFFIVPA
jgi:hypothetical protein